MNITQSVQKKIILAVCASIALTVAPLAQAFNFTWKHGVILALGAGIVRLVIKEASKEPVHIDEVPAELKKALQTFKSAKTSTEKKVAWMRVLQILDDSIIGFSGKRKGSLVLDDENKVVVDYTDIAPYGLLGTTWAYLKPIVKEGKGTLEMIAVSLAVYTHWQTLTAPTK